MAKTREIQDPWKYFSDWVYQIGRHHWENLGVVSTLLVHREKTKALRDRLKAEGMTDPKERAKHAVHRRAYVDRAVDIWEARSQEQARLLFGFREGYIFRDATSDASIQVLAVLDNDLEVAERVMPTERLGRAYRLTDVDFAEHLRWGASLERFEVPASSLRSELIRAEVSRDQRELHNEVGSR
ncbi:MULTISPECIES: hypothetical protein [unclassified Thioalkalivibrio]|uniref:hypothetical protein n=1 Tax=unclassified Thioalkalivibrio TaxID=2621013 RepID=UPI00036BF334|nr:MULTISPECIES: hypothetical protein [unclassified Thioalkalivibrio]